MTATEMKHHGGYAHLEKIHKIENTSEKIGSSYLELADGGVKDVNQVLWREKRGLSDRKPSLGGFLAHF